MNLTVFVLLLVLAINNHYIKNVSAKSDNKDFMVPLLNSVVADPEFLLLDSDLQRRVILNIYTLLDPDFIEKGEGEKEIQEKDRR